MSYYPNPNQPHYTPYQSGGPPPQPYPQQQPYQQPPPQQFGGGGGYGAPPPLPHNTYNGGGFNNGSYSGGPPSGPPPPQQPSYGGGYPTPPPSAPYGGPPAPYQQPPQQQMATQGAPLWYLGAIVSPLEGMNMGLPLQPPPTYNASFDADRLRKATKGFGTNERTLIDVLTPLGPVELAAVSRTFEAQVGRSLVKTLEKETSSWLLYALRSVALGPLAFDAWLIHRACDGMGTHEDILNEVLLGRSNNDIYLLKAAYRAMYNKELTAVVEGDLSFKTKRLFSMALMGSRDENPNVDYQAVEHDVRSLHSAAAGFGTDEIAISAILITRSPGHLAALAQAYARQYQKPLTKMILSEFSGHMQDGLYFIAAGAESDGHGVVRDADLLEEAMHGMGTKDERLTYRLVRGHWNRPRWEAVKQAYAAKHGRSLVSRVKGETVRDQEKVLVGIIGP